MRPRARRAARRLSGTAADGDAPGCRRAILGAEDARPDGEPQRRVEHRGLAVDAGVDRTVGADLEARDRPLAPGPAPGVRPGRSRTAIPRTPASTRGRVPTRSRARGDSVVRHQQRRASRVLAAVGTRPAQADPVLAVRGEVLGQHRHQRAQLRVAVARPLHGVGVDAERDVVDEYSPVDLARSIRRSPPSTNASRAPTTSSRSTPRSSAKWLRVPAGTHA